LGTMRPAEGCGRERGGCQCSRSCPNRSRLRQGCMRARRSPSNTISRACLRVGLRARSRATSLIARRSRRSRADQRSWRLAAKCVGSGKGVYKARGSRCSSAGGFGGPACLARSMTRTPRSSRGHCGRHAPRGMRPAGTVRVRRRWLVPRSAGGRRHRPKKTLKPARLYGLHAGIVRVTIAANRRIAFDLAYSREKP
jgi:hypothetical protein